MTTTTTTSFAELAFGSKHECEHELTKKLSGSRKRALKTMPGVQLDDEEVVAAVVGSMDGPIGDVFRGVWDQLANVKQACVATAAGPLLEQWVSFGRQRLSTTKRSDLVVDLAAVPKVVMKFVLKFEMKLESVRLHVQGGHLVGVSPGRASASGTFGYTWGDESKPREIASWKPRPLALPDYVRIEPVVPAT